MTQIPLGGAEVVIEEWILGKEDKGEDERTKGEIGIGEICKKRAA